MATKREKQQLLDTLKFTPTPVSIQLSGYGGECYIGRVTRAQYEFFRTHEIDVEQYASDWDDDGKWNFVPDDARPFAPGTAYECDDLFHASGATMDGSSRLTVCNTDTGQDLFETSLAMSDLEDQGITVSCDDDFDSADLDPGTVVFWGGQGEKGCFFDGEVVLRAPFDPALLTVTYGNGDDWYLVTGVEYDGEDVDGSGGYSTTGKWTEHKFWISGDEEVYQGVSRDDDWPADVEVLAGEEMQASEAIDSTSDEWQGIPLSPWHSVSLRPDLKGEYDVCTDTWPFPQRAQWTGRTWKDLNGHKIDVAQWRGLSGPA